jgi:hypothetical protein
MARPIEPTPRLRGQDAVRFIQASQTRRPFKEPEFDLEKMSRDAEEWLKKQKEKRENAHA